MTHNTTPPDLTFNSRRVSTQTSVGSKSGSSLEAAASTTAPLLLAIFLFSILLPVYFNVGETRLSITRLVLLIMIVPLLFRLLSGKAGRILSVDIFMVIFVGWIVLTILVNNGTSRLPLAVATVVEVLGGYLVGRTLIRNPADYRTFIKYLIVILLILFPFSVLEFFTNINLIQDLFEKILPTLQKPLSLEWRNGFSRVMSGFEHPILYGLFCAMTVAPIYYFLKSKLSIAIIFTAFAFGMTYMSLSSAPIIAAGICILLILWDNITGSKWKLLCWITIVTFIFLSVASNRGPLVIMIDYLTFNAHTAWTRIWTFHYGSIQVLEHPFLGMGIFDDWKRGPGLTPSVDNFWLLIAMRHGLTGLGFLVLALSLGLRSVIRLSELPSPLDSWRTGYVVALVGLYFSLATVHVWGNTSSFIMCFVGSGLWLCSMNRDESDDYTSRSTEHRPSLDQKQVQPGQRNSLPTSRFGQNRKRR